MLADIDAQKKLVSEHAKRKPVGACRFTFQQDKKNSTYKATYTVKRSETKQICFRMAKLKPRTESTERSEHSSPQMLSILLI